MATHETLRRALEKVSKWRSLFAGWQLGTRADTDPECQAVRDHRDLSMFARIDINSLIGLLLKKGVFTEQEWIDALQAEAEKYDKDLEKRFPGCSTSYLGLHFDSARLEEITKWMKGWKP